MASDPILRELQAIFLDEARQLLDEAEETLLQLENEGFREDLINKAFRLAHNFKGSANSVGFQDLGQVAHQYEDILSCIKSGQLSFSPALISALLSCNDLLRSEIKQICLNPEHCSNLDSEVRALNLKNFTKSCKDVESTSVGYEIFPDADQNSARSKTNDISSKSKKEPSKRENSATANKAAPSDETLRIPSKRLDALLNIIGEIVVNQSILDDCRARNETDSEIAGQSILYMSKLIGDLHNLSLYLRLVPIKPLFQKLRRTARDCSESLGKEIQFIEEGEHCELDKGVIDQMADPLNHMVRNAVDHGIESADERKQHGKLEQATIQLKALTLDDQVKIIVSDNGRGLDREKILAKARSNGMLVDDTLSDQEVFQLIFAPGFSTKDEVTSVSGRGVGMEIVQKAVEDLKGSIKIDSKIGKGTSFEISLPLSLSIIGGMVIQADGQRFVIPVSQLVETIELTKYTLETVTNSGNILNLRGEVLPVYHLGQILGRRRSKVQTLPRDKDHGPLQRPALITHLRGKKVSFEVDQIVSQQKIVLKRLGKEFEGIPGVVAGAILSNGEPGLVLSLDKLVSGA